MASKNKTYIQKAIDNTLKSYESPAMGFLRVDRDDIEKLRENLYAIISGNEEEYEQQINDRLQIIEEKLAIKEAKEQAKLEKAERDIFDEQEVRILGIIPKKNIKLQRDSKAYSKGKVIGFSTAALVTIGLITLVSCGSSNTDNKEEQSPIVQTTVEPTVTPIVEENDKQKEAEEIINLFSENISANVINSTNEVLSKGVKLVEFDLLEEQQQKELIAGMMLQYYLAANIDDITTLEYANFMKEQSNAVLDNDDLIYNFRNINVLLKQQMLVSNPDNMIDFSTIYQDELDSQLLNDGAIFIARLNASETKKERKEISKEFYEYIQNTILNSTSELKYSNSAMAAFINIEFSAWKELTKSSGYSYGYYPDDELEAKVMTVVSNCGMSEGEKSELELQDSTKTTLESINIIRIINTLNERKENILTLSAINELYYINGASYGELRNNLIPSIDLTLYKKIQSYTEMIEETIIKAPAEKHKNDSGVSNGQGGTIAQSEFEEYNIDSQSPTAKEDYEQAVQEKFEQTAQESTVVKNNSGEVIDPVQAASWAKQGAIDANNGTKNNNVPALYQEAYNNGWNAANEAKKQAEQNSSSSTTFVPENNGTTSSTIIEETEQGFIEVQPTPTPEPENPNTESETTFVPITDGESSETIIEETYEGFVDVNYAPRIIEVNTLTRNDRVQSYKELKKFIEQINKTFDSALSIYNDIDENHMTK